jgi:multiple sugar transport system ATP-binding protein
VFQNYALYPHMSVRKNMSYGLKLTSDLSDDQINRRVEEAAKMMGIEELLDKLPENLSGGQQQRVATGRAIVRDPEAFLMDEPLSNLDAKLKIHMRTELQRIQEELNTTTIDVTHDQEEAMTMSDRIVVLAVGKLQQVGTPDEVYHQPANRFVADFIGSPSMNFFDVELRDGALVGSEFRYPLSAAFVDNLDASNVTTLIFGVRTEHIAIEEGESDGGIRATVDVVEPVGSDNYIYLHIGEYECILRTSRVRPSAGTSVNLSFDESSLHLFDAETNESVFESQSEYLPSSS